MIEKNLKQRVLGIVVLILLLAFCLAALLQGGKKSQPLPIPAINTHPPIAADLKSAPDLSAPLPAKSKTPAVLPAATPVLPMPAPAQATDIVKSLKPLSPQTVPANLPVLQKTIQKPSQKPFLPNPPALSKPAQKNLPHYFLVQAGAFSQAVNAKNLVEKLHQKNISANTYVIKRHKNNSSFFTGVRVGGKGVSRSEAEKLKVMLEKEFHLNPIIIEVK